jgi:Holliday junction resolvase
MANSNYRKGADFERQFMKHYQKYGCLAFRTAGSHSMVDVIIIYPENGYVALCQLKRYKKNKPKIDEEFANFKINKISKWWVSRKDREDWQIDFL